jgi:glutathione peroxidase-family protein
MLKSLMTEIFGVGPNPETSAGDLHDLRWEKRVVVVFADVAGVQAAAQVQSLINHHTALETRDLAVLRVDGNDVDPVFGTETQPLASSLRHELGNIPGAFAVFLIGKDGHVKQQFTEPVDPAVLFSAIDDMPMRQAEITRSTL